MDNFKLRPVETWLRKTKEIQGAIVLGGSVNGLSFARSLGRRGIPTILMDSDRLIGTYTRYGEFLLLPSVDEYADEWQNTLISISERLSKEAIIFATSDSHSMFIAANEHILKKHFRYLIPDILTMETILNKREQYVFVQKIGIPIPKTYFPENTSDMLDLANNISYPCILKPYSSHIGRKIIKKKVVISHTSEELLSQYSNISIYGTEFMLQEIVPGGDETLFGYLALWDGEELHNTWLTKQKLRQDTSFGDGSFQITVENGEILQLSRKILHEFRYRGFVGIEFRYDNRDQIYRLIEINPRTVSGNQLAISAGIDFPWIGYLYLTGRDNYTNMVTPFNLGVKYVNEELDLKSYLAKRKEGKLTFWQWLRSLRDVKALAIGAWDDPLPFIVMFWRLVKAFFGFLFIAKTE